MLRKNDAIVVSLMKDKDIFIAGGVIKNTWIDGKPSDETYVEVTGFVILEDLDFQVYKFKYANTDSNIKKIIEMKTKGLLRLSDMPGFSIDELYNYKDMYMGQNLVEMGEI